MRRFNIAARIVVMTTIVMVSASCSSSDPGDSNATGPVVLVEVTSSSTTVAVGSTLQLTATAKNAGGETLSSASFTWFASSPAATVNNSGLVTGVSPGVVTITARAEGVSGGRVITVN